MEAQHKVDNTESIVSQSAETRDSTEELITNRQDAFDEQYHQNERDIHDIDIELERLDEKITELNTMVIHICTIVHLWALFKCINEDNFMFCD